MVQSDSTLARWAEHRPAGFIPDSVVHPAAGPTPRVTAGVARNVAAVPELFADRALAATRGFRETEGDPLPVRRAKMLVRILRDHPIVIQDGEVIVGTKTRTPRGSPVFPEINCAWVERDLDRLSSRANTPFFVADDDEAGAARAGLPVLEGEAGCRSPDGVGAAGVVARRRSRRPLPLLPIAHHRPHQRRLREGAGEGVRRDRRRRAGRARLASRRQRDGVEARVPGVGPPGVRRRRRLRPPSRGRGSPAGAGRAERRAPPRTGRDGRGVRARARRSGPDLPRGAAVDVVHAPRAEPRDRRPRIRPRPLRPVPVSPLPAVDRLGET